jgi:probable HAF family extracellular repeat protein
MKRWMVLLVGVGLVFSAGAVSPRPAGQVPYGSFQALGFVDPYYLYSTALDVSLDGATVVGITTRNGFVWKEPTGSVALPGVFDISSAAEGVSSDGMIVAGSVYTEPWEQGQETCRWTFDEGQWVPEVLGDLAGGEYRSYARGMSLDGNVIVGLASSDLGAEACSWTLSDGTWVIAGLGDLPGGAFWSEAYGCSADGSVVIGQGSSDVGCRAFRWTEAGMVDLGVVGKRKYSAAWGCSSDGSVVVGETFTTRGRDEVAFRWTAATGMVSLGVLPGGKYSEADAVSPDGSVVVGGASTKKDGVKAFIWDAANGMLLLEDVLAAHNVFPPAGWKLVYANGIATPEPGVIVIVGLGLNPDGNREAWRAVIGN